MDSKKALEIIGSIAAVLFSLFLIQSVLTGGGSALGKLFLYLSIGGAICGFISPRAGLLFLIVAGYYLDMMKRFLVVEGVFSFVDLVQILALAPITFAGILAGQMTKSIFKGEFFGRKEVLVFVGSVLLSMSVIVLGVAQSGFGVRSIAEAGSKSAYISFMWLAFYLLRTSGDRKKFLDLMVVFFVPVLAYAYKQLLMGYSDLEVNYSLSGLTKVTTPLKEGKIEYYRIFSTMSSSGAFGLMAIVVGSYCLLAFRSDSRNKMILTRIFGLLCLISLIPGAGRTGWAIAVIIVICFYMFRSKLSTLLVYGAVGVLLTILFTNGEALIEIGAELTQGAADGDWEARSLQVGNFTDRTRSIQNWTTNPSYFSYFGLSKEEKENVFVHEMFGEIFVSYGLVGLVSVIIGIVSILVFAHFKILTRKDTSERNFMIFLLAVIFGLLLGSIISGGGIRIFPVVFYFWAFIGMLLVMITEKSVVVSPIRGEKGNLLPVKEVIVRN